MPMHQNTRRHVLRLSCGFVLLCLLQLWICEGFKNRPIAKIATTTAPNNIVATRQVSGGEQINKFSEYFREEGKKIISSTILAGAIVGQLLVASPAPAAALTEEQRLVADAWRTVNRAYVDPTFNGNDWQAVRLSTLKQGPWKSKGAAYASVRGMLALLGDPYTRFLTPSEFESLYSSARGGVAGIGVELATEGAGAAAPAPSPAAAAGGRSGGGGGGGGGGSRVVVTGVVPGGPAEAAGLRRGDTLTGVNGVLMAGKTAEDAAALSRGDPGTPVTLTFLKGDTGKELRETLVRRELKLQSATAALEALPRPGPGGGGGGAPLRLGVVRVKFFDKGTAAYVREALARLGEQGAEGWVIDLRHCPGGYFNGGVDVARLFLPAEKTIVYVADRNGIADYYETIEDGPEAARPLFVVVDEKTASASEVLTGALADNGRAVVVGRRTFGKARVQTLNQLEDGSGLAVTVSRYETPAHTDINKVGIPADVEAECPLEGSAAACLGEETLRRGGLLGGAAAASLPSSLPRPTAAAVI